MAKKKKKFRFVKWILMFLFLCILVVLYSYYVEPRLIGFKEYEIKNENVTDNFDGFKIVHISDIHYGTVYDKKLLSDLVLSINRQEPDIVVLTGDLIDSKTKMTIDMGSQISEELSKIEATIGKYAINGEDDLKFDEWTNIISNGGFVNLNNGYDTIYKKGYNFMFIAGLSSKGDKMSVNDKLGETINYLNSFEKDGPIYKILLIHEPDLVDEIEGVKFDLILAGHSHHGQIKLYNYPLFVPVGAKKYPLGHYGLDGGVMYVSNGLGTSDFDFRLFNTPSYNIYKFNK